jgi:hypothetical protein
MVEGSVVLENPREHLGRVAMHPNHVDEEQGLESGKKVLEAFVTQTRVNRVEPRLSGIGKLYWAAFTDILIVLRRIRMP